MEIGVKQAAELLNVSDKTIYRWVSAAQVPFYRVGAQYRFSRNELLAWAAGEHSVAAAEMAADEPMVLSLANSLRAGGIFYRVGGADVRGVLEAMLGLMKLPSAADIPRILERLWTREQITTTGLGDGIAFPHCRELAIPDLSEPILALGFLEASVDFKAIDKKPVDTVFMLLSPSARSSIRLMSRLAYAVRQPRFSQLLHEIGSRDRIFEEAEAIDHILEE